MQIELRDVPEADSPTTTIPLHILEGEGGRPEWTERRVNPIPPRQSEGALDFSHFDPNVDFVWSQDDWSGGGLEPYWRVNTPNKYFTANGVDTRSPGLLRLLPQAVHPYYSTVKTAAGASDVDSMGTVIANPGAEGQFIDWTVNTGAGIAAGGSPTNARTGDYSFQIVTNGNTVIGTDFIYQDLQNFAVFQGKSITVSCYVKRDSGDGSIRIAINDGVGTTAGSTSITSSSYTLVSVTRSIDASATRVRISLEAGTTSESGISIYYADDFKFHMAGAVKKFAIRQDTGDVYCIAGSHVLKFDGEENWDMVLFEGETSDDAVDIAYFNGNMWVAYGDNAYYYGTDTSWTASNLGTTLEHAHFFTTARDANGTLALWKDEDGKGTLKNSADPTNGGTAWSSAITVGDTNVSARALVNAFDSVQEFKDDGLWVYTRLDPNSASLDNLFYNITPNILSGSNDLSYVRPVDDGRWLWFNIVPNQLWRWNPAHGTQDLTRLFQSSRVGAALAVIEGIEKFSGKLWLVGRTYDDNSIQVLTLQETTEGFSLHPLYELEKVGDDTVGMALGRYSDSTRRFVFIAGKGTISDNTDFFISAVELPRLGDYISTLSGAIRSAKSGTIESSIWHGGAPSLPKSFLYLETWTEDVDSTHTIKVAFKIDGASSWTTLTTFNSAGAVQTAYFQGITNPETNAVGRAIQLRFTLTNDNGDQTNVKMFSFALHATARVRKIREWELLADAGGEGFLESGYFHPSSVDSVLSAIDTLEDQTYPIVLAHRFDNPDGLYTEQTVFIKDVERVKRPDGGEAIRLVLQEAHTSA